MQTLSTAHLAELWNIAAPQEPLSHAEIATVCSDGVVFGTRSAAVAAVVRGGTRGHIRLIAVHPDHRREGLGTALLNAAHEWLITQGATRATFGADAPYYLWPGIDATNLGAQALAMSAGYTRTGASLNLSIPTGDLGAGGDAIRATRPEHVASLRELIDQNWPVWWPEVELGVAQGSTFVVVSDDRVTGFCNHSSLRRGWIGPMGTDPDHRQHGVGRALLQAVLADLAAEGFDQGQIAWVGPLGYFADLGATTSRVFLHYSRDLITSRSSV